MGTSRVQRAPGGGRWKITLVSYDPNVHEPSPDAGIPLVAGITIRIRNLGTAPVRARGLGSYSVLELLDDTGASPIARTSGPCDGQFARTSLRISPGAAVQGCLPYEYTVYEPPIQFLFGLGKRATHGWRLPH